MSLHLDYNYMMDRVLGTEDAVSEKDFLKFSDLARMAEEEISKKRADGGLRFLDTQFLKGYMNQVQGALLSLDDRIDTLVVLGIGGSALGARAVQQALVGSLDTPGRRTIIVDNVDPVILNSLIQTLDFDRTAFNIISKSGGTVETMSQFMIFMNLLREKLGKEVLKTHIICTTDPEAGLLRRIANQEGFPTLDVPPAIGGRYSILTPVGLFPSAVMGVDIQEMLAGAERLEESFRGVSWRENPAYMYGFLMYIADVLYRRNVAVLMPYASNLYNLSLWYMQLWAESLGKKKETKKGHTAGVGQTPVAAVGATDQHSLLQLFSEGPLDKVITFIAVKDFGVDITIPNIYSDLEPIGYLGGKTMGTLLDTERRATEAALAFSGRLSMTLTIPSITAESIGALFYFFEAATAFAGHLYGIDPFNQPGVEEGKQYTGGLLGRPGYEKMKERFDKRPKKEDAFTLES
ncbi:MAG: glucose-6-phosphate isomerase [Deltaproteobacteria bacterium]|nr:glucose-6-phosphate isomerase [Candidatus Zymogenaceae bacterium]